MNKQLIKRLQWLFTFIAVGFLVTGLICEYAAIWANQWAKRDSIGLLSDQLQSTAILNIIMFCVFFFLMVVAVIADDSFGRKEY